MENCKHCGTKLPADAAFCPNCSTRVTSTATASSSTNPAPADYEQGSLSGLETVLQSGAESVPEFSLLEEGEEFHGRYLVQRKIGQGAMGVVYLADDQITDQQVALKLITPALVKSPTAIQRFLREGLTARDVRHPNVIAMYDVGDDNGQLYLVMEYLKGENLRSWIHRALQSGKDLPFKTALDIVTEILKGLQAAHGINVVHRDLKPENIMLLSDPLQGEYQLKILDFGVARAIDAGPASQLTSAGMATGTPLYMAPEQRTAADTVGPSADLYAATAIFYELLMGVPPEGRWGHPSREIKGIPAAVDGIIDKGLSSRPRSRFQSAEEYLAVLKGLSSAPLEIDLPEPIIKPKPTPKPKPQPVPDPEPKADRKKLWYGLAAVILVLGFIGFIEEEYNLESGGQFEGLWYDEVPALNVVHAYVEINQSGNAINGDIYNMQDNPVGSMSGSIQGQNMTYSYNAQGQTGSGIGVLRPDGIHIDINVKANSTGFTEQHVLHKDHMPN